MITNNIHRLNHIHMPQRDTHTKLGSNLPLILLFRLTAPLWSKLFNGIGRSTLLLSTFDESDRTARTRSQDFAPFPIFLGQMRMSRFVQGWMSQRDDWMRHTRVIRCVLGRRVSGCRSGGSRLDGIGGIGMNGRVGIYIVMI